MATHSLGKLKFNLSKQGLDFRWGDGETKHLFGRKPSQGDDAERADEYMDGGDEFADPGYDDGRDYGDDVGFDEQSYDDGYADDGYADDGYADDDGYEADNGYTGDGYADDGYADDGYADDGYQDDGYQDDGYQDDGYQDDGYQDDGYQDDGYQDDGYQDDGYQGDGYQDDGYGDDGYGDDGYQDDGYGDGGYDDRYSEADADDGYGGDYQENQSALMQYVEENDWVTYLLLFLLPPLGIYLLWRRGKFEKPIRIAVSVASGVWFIVALVLIFTNLFGATQDATQDATITLAPSATMKVGSLDTSDGGGAGLDLAVDNVPDGDSAEDGSGGDTAPEASAEPTAEPSPTPLAGGSAGATSGTPATSLDYVYSPATGMYYHSRSDCENIGEGVSVARVPKSVAENNRKQSACPVCISGGGSGDTNTYYATRTGSYYHLDKGCQGMTGAVAYTKEAAEKAGKTPCPVCVSKTASSLKTGDVKFVTSSTKDKSKINVYYTKGGKYYHMTANCSGMTGATRASLKNALLAGKAACPTCCKAAGTSVYCTKDGNFYHTNKTCSGMKDALEVSLAEALVLGKTRCKTCVKSGSLPTASQLQKASDAGDDGTYVYGTANGKYYHTDANCSGMKDAQRYTLKSMLQQKRKACPVCASAADTVVYTTGKGQYYHSYATCSGMTSAKESNMAEAISKGYKRCPKCWSASTSMAKARGHIDNTAGASADATSAPGATATASNTYVYATKEGSYYHLTSNCSGMKGASRITLKQAVNAGKKACPNCAGSTKRTVYSTEGGKNYHAASECRQSGMKNGEPKTLAKALMLGQTACKYCIGKTVSSASSKSSSATTTSSKSSGKTSAGTKTSGSTKTSASTRNTASGKTDSTWKSGTAVSAKSQASIEKAAAKLVNSHTYKSGKSGIKVYARADGKYYHRNSSCSGMIGASHMTLETAMNYGKTACPKCCSSARRTVYATKGAKYYHYSKDHAGSGATKGTLASALAYGYKACPYCVTKTKTLSTLSADGGKGTYKSGTSGIKVYATVDGKYYHSRQSCGDMKNPSRVTLETAMNYGKKPCPKCMSAASKKVYSTSGDKYYHYYKQHAGSSAKAGTLAQAKATGKKVCPTCAKLNAAGASSDDVEKITSGGSTHETSGGVSAGYESVQSSTEHYSAPANTTVYVDTDSAFYFFYHKNSRCPDMDMKKGSKITLQYAKEWGYKACPACHPPTSVK